MTDRDVRVNHLMSRVVRTPKHQVSCTKNEPCPGQSL